MTVSNNKLYEDNKFEYMVQQESNLESALEMGLTKEEYNLICTKIKKIPNKTELGIFSAMFSEHCSYKSSKNGLKLCLLKLLMLFKVQVKTLAL